MTASVVRDHRYSNVNAQSIGDQLAYASGLAVNKTAVHSPFTPGHCQSR